MFKFLRPQDLPIYTRDLMACFPVLAVSSTSPRHSALLLGREYPRGFLTAPRLTYYCSYTFSSNPLIGTPAIVPEYLRLKTPL